MELQQAERLRMAKGGWHWQMHLQTECAHDWTLPSVAPSMWHLLVRSVEGCWGAWWTCAMYVGIPSLSLANEWDLRHLCSQSQIDVEKKSAGDPAQRIPKNSSISGTWVAQVLVCKLELSHLSPVFTLPHRWRNSRICPIYIHRRVNLPYQVSWQQEHDGCLALVAAALAYRQCIHRPLEP